jgi:hypothetical protein
MEVPKGRPMQATFRTAQLYFKWLNTELTKEEEQEMLALDPLFPWRKKRKAYEARRLPPKEKP